MSTSSISGVGYGLMFGPCMVVVGQYFNKRRSLANGLAAAGGSLGQLCIPMAITYFLKEYGYTVCIECFVILFSLQI